MTVATLDALAAAREPRKLFPLRKRTGTAAHHLSKAAVDFGNEDLERLTDKEAIQLLADARWGSFTTMSCVHCGTLDEHYWRPKDKRWKCKCCGKTFSVTSNTVLADHKLPLTKILKIVYAWSSGASGVPALQLRRQWNVAYGTVFSILHKMREGVLRGFNTGVLCGVHEMDGMDVNGRRYREKRNKPQVTKRKGAPSIPPELLKAELMGPPDPPKRGKAASQPVDRRIMMVLRSRGPNKGRGGAATRVAIAITESSRTAIALATRFASAESTVISDEDTSYASFSKLFAEHRSISHSEHFSDGKGTSNNLAESFNHRVRRAVEGIYLNPSNKYLHDYAAEQAWREDTRRLPTSEKLKHLLRYALRVGLSQWWRGYSHMKHRKEEFLLEGNRQAVGRGRPPGWKPKPPK